ncbi:MAG TPA: glycosyltransferase family 4 protein [Thermoanaerobaculia bacterium]
MRIVQVVPAITIGGVWRQIQSLSSLHSRDFKSIVISLFDLDDEIALRGLSQETIRLQLQPERYRDEKEIRSALISVFRDISPNLIHSHHFYTDVYAIPCAATLGIDIIRSVHGITQVPNEDIFQRKQIKTDWSAIEVSRELELEPHCRLTLTASNDLRRKLLNYGFDPSKIEVLYPGVDPHANARDPDHRREHGANRCFEVGFVGRLEPVKNPFAVLTLARSCAENRLPVKLTLVGEGRLLSPLKEAIVAQGLAEYIALLPATSNALELMHEFDALLLPSYSEGCPLVMLEAMAIGLPVLASRVGGIPEVIAHGENGFLFDPSDVNGMRTTLERLLLDDNLRSNISDRSRETVRSRFALNDQLDRLASIYERWMK